MSHALDAVAPAFVDMAHRIVWCTVATVDSAGEPRTRILHPIWEWDGEALTGWIATSPLSPKAKDLAERPAISLTYWDPTHDTATAECGTTWDDTPELREEGWRRFAEGPAPVGYDPSIIPFWTDPQVEAFGILRLAPRRLRVMPGTFMLQGQGEVLTWEG
jgi:Pyridoxamine 5'-phosphate oxidase